ncbi:3-deoxy-manno-octulosonate cytidylyltransferase [Roseisolibacter sp. H3M3-2]|uniref:3-deoxy-manno-octulosonate cytidylyltransferase n=1 Tax=Roseisolibacter sp. H3M3-2 TaxID=3031323 RepID=UPI0023DC0D23|nr:3-deoxy-manno-octulosonate cytidylyltransferase [Roseisolibacter sp. H3M3-2]MDF1502012.1 3-deoxy-manno-octulosonate cytidylyltransferase [Roseisolibacter sp. H3M3-2]
MRLLAVIPARLGATRLPRKPLRLLGGRPLVVRVWEHVARLGVADRCVVATDHPDVAAAVRDAGGEAVLTRDDHPSGTDRVAEVARLPEFAAFDAVVNIQGDEPFASAEVVHAASSLVVGGRFPLGTVACPAPPDVLAAPDAVKVVTTDDGRALYFSRAPIPFLREGGDAGDRARRDALVRRHVGIYAYTRDALERWVAAPPHPLELVERLEQLRPLAAGTPIGVAHVPEAPPAGIDTEQDLADANARWAAWEASRPSAIPRR